MSASTGPLAGVKVLELGTLIAGPFASRFMGEFGADVIKIEDPNGGDPLRKWRKLYPEVGGTSLWWAVQARNKKSVTVNLKAPEGKEIVRRLAKEADIVVENFRPGLLEKLGLGYEVLSADNPGLVMVRLSGYGQTGPYRDRPGFGAIAESMGGLRHITGYPDLPPPRIGISIGDSIAALHGVIGALMALHHRQANGGTGPGGRCRALRSRLQHDGKRRAGIRRVRDDPRTHGRIAAGHRAVEYVSMPRRQHRDRRQ